MARFHTSLQRWVPGIGYVLLEPLDRKDALEDDQSARGTCSELIPELPQAHRRKPMLCFVGFVRGQLSHVARGEARYKARSGNDKLDMWEMEELPKPVPITRLRRALDRTGARVARAALQSGGHLSPKAFGSFMAALEQVDADAFRVAEGLINREAARHSLPENARENLALQRDAVLTALDIAHIPREQLPARPPDDGATTARPVSLFDGIGEVRGLEDVLVMHDLNGAEGWQPLRTHRYPVKTFTNGATVLSVVLANKLPLERQLGVDLIYLNETLRAVVFVQYKILRGEDGEDGYRPDKQLEKEIARMDKAAAMFAALPADQGTDSYRLSREAFFLKFCRSVLDERDSGMVPGHYLPLEFWKRLAVDPRVKGKRGPFANLGGTLGSGDGPLQIIHQKRRGLSDQPQRTDKGRSRHTCRIHDPSHDIG
jgi:hypothetical protein